MAKKEDFEQIVKLFEALQTFKKLNHKINIKKLYFDLTYHFSNTLIFVCTNHEDEILAVRGVGVANTNCFDIYSAISYNGKKNYAGHYLFEKIVEHLKLKNYHMYDLGGINQKSNQSSVSQQLVSCAKLLTPCAQLELTATSWEIWTKSTSRH